MPENHEQSPGPAAPAATLVLFRQPAGRDAEHLMIMRTGKASFAAGALVFPGGRVETGDSALAEDESLIRGATTDTPDAAARVAAIRETIEETGVATAIEPSPDADTIRQWRAALAQKTPFATLLAEAGARIDLQQLVPFARWSPPRLHVTRRFDTRFFLARADHASTAEVDHGEALSHLWLSARAILDAADAGRHQIIFPTRRNLERLAAFPDFDAAAAHARTAPAQTIIPWVETIDGEERLCIPKNAGYPVTSAPLAEVFGGT